MQVAQPFNADGTMRQARAALTLSASTLALVFVSAFCCPQCAHVELILWRVTDTSLP